MYLTMGKYWLVWTGWVILITTLTKGGTFHPAIEYLHPLPESRLHSNQTTIIMRLHEPYYDEITNLSSLIRVYGVTREYQGDVILSSDEKTIIFKPREFFETDEILSVSIQTSQVGHEDFLYSFSTASTRAQAPTIVQTLASDSSVSLLSEPMAEDVRIINGVAVPSDFPEIQAIQNSPTAPGLIFYATNYPNTTGNYLIICHNDGTPYFYRKITDVVRSGNFLLHPNGLLSYHLYDQRGRNYWRHVILNEYFEQIDVYNAGHGYTTDNHEFQFLPNGHALIIGHQVVKIDVSQIIPGASRNASVQGMHLQELDADKNVIFEWRSWDNFRIEDAIAVNLYGSNIDYVHMNSIDIDYDGHYIISSRNLNEITKINRNTGDIMWRLGGRNNQFEYIHDEVEISWQHDARPVAGKPNHYLIFDNGRQRSPRYSRSVEYKIDTNDMTAENVWQFRYTPDRRVGGMGSSQRLPNGNTLIDWPQGRTQTCEVTPEGEIMFELYSYGHSNYRCRRFDWYGQMRVPYLLLENHGDFIRLFFNKFGDPNVHQYNIYYGQNGRAESLLASTEATYYDVHVLESFTEYGFRVTAVNHLNEESDSSPIEIGQIEAVGPGQNLVTNGHFQSLENWNFVAHSDAYGSAGITQAGECLISTVSAGTEFDHIRLYQDSIPVIQGKTYTLRFDIYADQTRAIEVKLQKATSPHTNYSRFGYIYVNTQKKSVRLTFTMQSSTDTSAQLVFDCGRFTGELFLDNVSLSYED